MEVTEITLAHYFSYFFLFMNVFNYIGNTFLAEYLIYVADAAKYVIARKQSSETIK